MNMEMVIKPTFNKKLRIVRTLIFTCFIPLLPAFFYNFVREFFDLSRFQSYSLLALFLISINAFWYFFVSEFYRKASYQIGEDSIIESTNFITAITKEINYSNIKEIKFSKGPLQRFFNLGNITLHTQASSSGGNNDSGMKLLDIQSVEDIYEKIKEKISGK